jgi:hypothetical protein
MAAFEQEKHQRLLAEAAQLTTTTT